MDRSGPLVKNLLRRSLSMDSQVPVYTPTAELQPPPGAGSCDVAGSVLRAFSSQRPPSKDGGETVAPDARAPAPQPHRLRSFSASQPAERPGAPPGPEVRVKAEPRSPPEPCDIIRVPVGDAAAATRETWSYGQKTTGKIPADSRPRGGSRPTGGCRPSSPKLRAQAPRARETPARRA